MFKVKILTPGKTKHSWLEQAIDEYQKRLRGELSLEWVFPKDDQLVTLADKEEMTLCFEPQGKLLTSKEFSEIFFSSLEKNGSRITCIIGGADGIPDKILKQSKKILSLSPMTFTHQITRLILIEQIYRSMQIRKGSNYHVEGRKPVANRK